MIIMLSFSIGLTAQTNTYKKYFGGANYEIGKSLIKTTNDGFVITGQTMSMGDTLGDTYLIKTDSSGNTIWEKNFSHHLLDGGNSIIQTSDGGFFITGHSETDLMDCQFFVLRLNNLGDTLWTKLYGGLGDDASSAGIECADGGFILAGYTANFGAAGIDAYVMKLNASGDSVWAKKYGGPMDDYADAIKQTSDGGFIFTGRTKSAATGYDVYLVKTDGTGNVQWQKTYGGNMDDWGYSVNICTDGGFIITGNTASFGSGQQDVYLIRTNSTGDTTWTKTFGGTFYDNAYQVLQTADGGFIAAGETKSFGDTLGDIYVVKTDLNGALVWQKVIGGVNEDLSMGLVACAGGYALTGSSYNVANGSADAVLIKIDDNGNYTTTGIKEFPGAFSNIKVFPNPSNSVANFIINNRQNKTLSFSLYDSRLAEMRHIDNINTDEFIFVNDGLKDGVYFYRFTDKNYKVIGTGKLIFSGK
ncbi:MAG: T9SS type A sorting domain-containing protein [Bacteroidia bacterium]